MVPHRAARLLAAWILGNSVALAAPSARDGKEALVALLAARVEIMELLADQGKKAEAMVELEAITAIELPPEAEDVAGSMLSVYLEGVERLVAWGEPDRAEKLARTGLARLGPDGLRKGYFLMALGSVFSARGEKDKALATMREAASLFEAARAMAATTGTGSR